MHKIDYVIQHGFNIIPIEIKAGASGSLKSLHSFMAEKNFRTAIKFDLNAPSIQNMRVKTQISKGEIKEAIYNLYNFPIYFADFIPDFLKNNRVLN